MIILTLCFYNEIFDKHFTLHQEIYLLQICEYFEQ